MRIGLDLDGVIVNSIPRWIEVLNREAGTCHRPGELPETHHTPELAAISDRNEIEMAILPGPMPGAAQALRQFKEAGHTLVVVTARAPRLRGLTEAWLAYHGMPVDALHFLEGAPKAPVVRDEGLDLFVEDTPRHALAIAEAGVPVLLFGHPYNAACSHPLIHRLDGWDRATAVLTKQLVHGYNRNNNLIPAQGE